MAKKFMNLLAAAIVIGGAATLVAQQPGPAKDGGGTLMVQDKNYQLTHALAWEDDDGRGGKDRGGFGWSGDFSRETERGEGRGKDDHDDSLNRPCLKLEFTKAGELSHWKRWRWHFVYERGAEPGERGSRGEGWTGEWQSQPAE